MQGPGSEHPSQLADKLLEILNICPKMNSVRERVALLKLLARETTRLMGADGASIFLLDREQHELWSIVSLDSPTILRFDATLGVAGTVVKTGQMINVADAQSEPRFYHGIDAQTGYHTRNLLAAPLLNLEGQLLGVFEVLNKTEGTFTRADEELLSAFAAQAAIAVETAAAVEELRSHRDHLLHENAHLRKEVRGKFASPTLLGISEPMQAVLRQIDQIKDSPVTVLITGESGTGKELVAKAIHYASPRAPRPFVALNCAALPENLVESELFGIEKGVATGVEARAGKFEVANGGTLFLDEVGDLSLATQAKCLRVLQERVIERVGGRRTIPVDVRIVAATNKELEAECKRRTFREDLYHRLNVIHLHLPSLRERLEDIPLLANYFLAKYCHELKKEPIQLSRGALRHLVNYPWPGNVRELENEMTRLVLSVPRKTVGEADLSEAVRVSGGRGPSLSLTPGLSMKKAVAELEKRLIRDALERHGQNQQRAAKALEVSRQGLIKKMKRYELKVSS
jgi:Nif-specific regulatory protein